MQSFEPQSQSGSNLSFGKVVGEALAPLHSELGAFIRAASVHFVFLVLTVSAGVTLFQQASVSGYSVSGLILFILLYCFAIFTLLDFWVNWVRGCALGREYHMPLFSSPASYTGPMRRLVAKMFWRVLLRLIILGSVSNLLLLITFFLEDMMVGTGLALLGALLGFLATAVINMVVTRFLISVAATAIMAPKRSFRDAWAMSAGHNLSIFGIFMVVYILLLLVLGLLGMGLHGLSLIDVGSVNLGLIVILCAMIFFVSAVNGSLIVSLYKAFSPEDVRDHIAEGALRENPDARPDAL